jgi:4'-phosphopantetheinyl transferase EntD
MNNLRKQLYTNFPKNISWACHSVNEENIEIPDFKEKSAREKEYCLGRYCAQQALEALHSNNHSSKIESSPHGFPIWPNGINGSISHSKGLCLSAVAKSIDYEAIGIDVEQFNRMKERSIERIVNPLEKAQIGNDLKKATLLFSIKEAFYKAQFPLHKSPLNFNDVALNYDFIAQTAQLKWIAEKLPISKSSYSDWVIAYQVIKDTCFVLCSKSNKTDKSN